jgi:hypothetical protein
MAIFPNLGVRLRFESSKYLNVFLRLKSSSSLTLGKISHSRTASWLVINVPLPYIDLLGCTRKLGSSYPLSPKGGSLSISLSISCRFYTYCNTLYTPS